MLFCGLNVWFTSSLTFSNAVSAVLRLDFVRHTVTFWVLLFCRGQHSELSRDAMGYTEAESCVSY